MGALGYWEQEHQKNIESKKAAFLITALQNYDRSISALYFLFEEIKNFLAFYLRIRYTACSSYLCCPK
jgi:hypothetical protein